VTVGVGASRGHEAQEADVIRGVRVYLWSREHGDRQEYDFIVPREAGAASSQGAAPNVGGPAIDGQTTGPEKAAPYAGIGLVRMIVTIQYRVKDLYRFGYAVGDGEGLLVDIATREVNRYAARADIDALMSRRREDVARDLHQAITQAADRLDLGVELVLVAPTGIHPPPAIADAFEQVVKADRERDGSILKARAASEGTLSMAAGSAALARALAGAAGAIESGGGAVGAEALRQADRLLNQAGGDAKRLLNEARAYRWQMVNAERGRWESFDNQLAAYRQAPEFYMLNEKLRVLTKGLKDARKYIIGIPPDRLEIRYEDPRRAIGADLPLGAK
jgi:regulator of protease activity HflC (stomatin/prohibitin superfamily)